MFKEELFPSPIGDGGLKPIDKTPSREVSTQNEQGKNASEEQDKEWEKEIRLQEKEEKEELKSKLRKLIEDVEKMPDGQQREDGKSTLGEKAYELFCLQERGVYEEKTAVKKALEYARRRKLLDLDFGGGEK